jgi:DNA replicative helicase MCM subunit Mcm2 (Cdc46/Mcm family)
LIRLTEARARLELREVATKEDAGDVIEIMKYRYCHYNTVVLELDKNCERGPLLS